jgi:arginine exporter protein ArgO
MQKAIALVKEQWAGVSNLIESSERMRNLAILGGSLIGVWYGGKAVYPIVRQVSLHR